MEIWRNNEEKIDNIQSRCDKLREELHAKEKAQAHIEQCRERLKHLNPSFDEVFEPWIYKKCTALFDLADSDDINGCRIHFDLMSDFIRLG